MSAEPSQDRPGVKPAIIVGGLILLAIVLRFWHLGDWNLEGDEIFTLRDSLSPRLSNPRPLLYFLNYYLIAPFAPLNELSLRILPAIFGVLAIPVFYLMTRRLIGIRAALFGTLMVTVSSLHVYQSQYARYWSLVFLLSTVYPFAVYLGIRDRNRRMLALGAVTGVLAVLAHPSSILPVGGLILWFWMTHPPRRHLARLWAMKGLRWAAPVIAILAVVVAVRYILILRSWILVRPGLHLNERLLFSPSGPGISQLMLVLAYIDSLTAPLLLAGAVGIYLLWKSPERPLAQLLLCLFLFPTSFIMLLSLLTAVSTAYVLSVAPIPFIGAGVFLDRLTQATEHLRSRYLIPASVVLFMMAAGAPTLISQYRDGRRFDFRGAARWLEPRLVPGDVVYSDQYFTMRHYLREPEARHLVANPTQLQQELDQLRQSGSGRNLWIVAPYSTRKGHRTTAGLGRLKEWIFNTCQLRSTVGVARLDFRVNELQIFQCR